MVFVVVMVSVSKEKEKKKSRMKKILLLTNPAVLTYAIHCSFFLLCLASQKTIKEVENGFSNANWSIITFLQSLVLIAWIRFTILQLEYALLMSDVVTKAWLQDNTDTKHELFFPFTQGVRICTWTSIIYFIMNMWSMYYFLVFVDKQSLRESSLILNTPMHGWASPWWVFCCCDI